MAATEFMVLTGLVVVGLLFFMVAQNFILGEGERTKEAEYKAEAKSLVSLIERVSSEPSEFVLYCQYITLCNISVKNGILTYEKDEVRYSSPVPKFVKDISLVETATVCIGKTEKGISLAGEKPVCVPDNACTLEECKEDCSDCYGPNSKCMGDTFCNNLIGENCLNSANFVDCKCDPDKCCPSSPDADIRGCSVTKNIETGKECWCTSQCNIGECNPTFPTFAEYNRACCEPGKGWDGSVCIDLVCPDNQKCPGAPMDGGSGDSAWVDSQGTVCCPFSGPVCSYKHCCPTNLPKWCEKPVTGEPRCMSETDYKDKAKCKTCKKTYILVVVANNYADMSAYKARANKEMQIVRDESPFRECPDCLDIKILDINCQASHDSADSIISCVHSNYGTNYNLIYVASADSWCNGYSLVGFPFTICGNGLPSGIKDTCAIHEIGHNAGELCDEYGYSYWVGEGCSASDWPQQYNLKASSGCNDFNCGPSDGGCCGTKLKPDDPSDRTVDIMGGGGGMKPGCSGMYVYPTHFRDFNYNRFKNQISDYCE